MKQMLHLAKYAFTILISCYKMCEVSNYAYMHSARKRSERARRYAAEATCYEIMQIVNYLSLCFFNLCKITIMTRKLQENNKILNNKICNKDLRSKVSGT